MTTTHNRQTNNPPADAHITWISGPVLRARTTGGFRINEAVLVGARRLLGEVIRIDADDAVVQVYEDTTGLRPGDPLSGTGSPLSVRLGPGLLGNIFDGLLNPLSTQSGWIKPGVNSQQQATRFPFIPRVKQGQQLSAGSVFGTVEREDARPQHCLLPPGCAGEVVSVAEKGHYTERETVCVVRDANGKSHDLAMSHRWPVRTPRPVMKRIPVEGPLFTGQRILDSVFPLSCGGRAAMPGGFGTGKTVLQETLAKWCDADVIIYVGCGERGNEMAGVLHEFPSLDDPRTGRPLM
jgi:V/A-type H+-transporting ATPase subunit A